MNNDHQKARRGYLGSVLGCYCPRCREGKIFEKPFKFQFTGLLKMNKTCPVCGQPTEIEVGFYYGTSYVSYMLAIALCVASFIAWWVIIGFSISDNRIFYWLVFNGILLICLQPWLMRLSRSLWLSWFVKYDPDWRNNGPLDVSERINKDQGNNW